MAEWNDVFLASAGASSALTGLIFVGLSINMNSIIKSKGLINRALVPIVLLLTSLIASIVILIPGEYNFVEGISVIVLAFISWIIIIACDVKIFRSKPEEFRKPYTFSIILNQISIVPYIISGLNFLAFNESGYYWAILSIIFSLIKSIIDAWVLLVEINR